MGLRTVDRAQWTRKRCGEANQKERLRFLETKRRSVCKTIREASCGRLLPLDLVIIGRRVKLEPGAERAPQALGGEEALRLKGNIETYRGGKHVAAVSYKPVCAAPERPSSVAGTRA